MGNIIIVNGMKVDFDKVIVIIVMFMLRNKVVFLWFFGMVNYLLLYCLNFSIVIRFFIVLI